MNLLEIVSSVWGRIFLGLIWGFGLASIIYNTCNGGICEVPVYQGPNPHEIRRSVFQHGANKNKEDEICYKYTPYVTKCPTA